MIHLKLILFDCSSCFNFRHISATIAPFSSVRKTMKILRKYSSGRYSLSTANISSVENYRRKYFVHRIKYEPCVTFGPIGVRKVRDIMQTVETSRLLTIDDMYDRLLHLLNHSFVTHRTRKCNKTCFSYLFSIKNSTARMLFYYL